MNVKMVSNRQRLALATLLMMAPCAQSFMPHSLSSRTVTTATTTQHHALPVDQLTDAALSWDTLVSSSEAALSQSQMLLADAAAASGEATGWWGAYINVFKSTLLWLHGSIDGPLRSVGFDQTWGVSIGLFTLCKYL